VARSSASHPGLVVIYKGRLRELSVSPNDFPSTAKSKLHQIKPLLGKEASSCRLSPTEYNQSGWDAEDRAHRRRRKGYVGQHILLSPRVDWKRCARYGRTDTNTDNSSFAIVVFRASSDEEARGIILRGSCCEEIWSSAAECTLTELHCWKEEKRRD